jgi:hypothetical protein
MSEETTKNKLTLPKALVAASVIMGACMVVSAGIWAWGTTHQPGRFKFEEPFVFDTATGDRYERVSNALRLGRFISHHQSVLEYPLRGPVRTVMEKTLVKDLESHEQEDRDAPPLNDR